MNSKNIAEQCLKEMFYRVGLDYPCLEFTKHPKWFEQITWTEAEECAFVDWMKDFVRRKTKWSKKTIECEVAFFLLMWEWKTVCNKEK